MTIRRYVEIIGTPVLVIGGYILLSGSNGFVSHTWDDFIGPFLITYWIGRGFVMTWDVARESLRGAPPGVAAFVGIAGALVLLAMLGGPRTLIDDPWLIGVAIAPGLELALPWWQKRGTAAAPES